MNDQNKIEDGDIVLVEMLFAHAQGNVLLERASVLGVPYATGDSWKFKCAKSGRIVYTSEPITLTLLEKDSE